MNASANVIVNILVNSAGSAAGVNSFNQQLGGIAAQAQRAASNAATNFNSSFGANFFANLTASMVQSFATGFSNVLGLAINTASKFEAAFKGAGSLGKNIGLSEAETIGAVKNLDLVKSGLLSVGDAALSMKNLLASGFGLQQSTEIIKRFGDTAAFGRQSTYTFGQAIATATEGIKNQNSILVDNAGVTKNLSVILKERGFELQDLSDKVKGAAAREALYQGLLKESSLQLGDSTKLLNTYQGKIVQVESAYQRFLASLGDFIIKNTAVQASMSGLVTVLDFIGKNTSVVVILTTALIAMAAAAALAATSTGALTASQIANSLAGSQLVTSIKAITLVLTGMQAVTTLSIGSMALLGAGILGVVGIVAAAVVAYSSYNSAQTQQVSISKAAVDSIIEQRDALTAQETRLNAASASTDGLSKESTALKDVYVGLNSESKTRVDVMSQEIGKTQALTAEVVALRNARNEELNVLARTTTGQLLEKINAINEKETAQAVRLSQIRLSGNLNGVQDLDSARTAALSRQAESEIADSRNAISALRTEATDLLNTQKALAGGLGVTTDQLIDQTSAFGTIQTTAADAKNTINFFASAQDNAVAAVDTTTDAIYDQIKALKGLEAQGNISGVVAARRKFINDVQAQISFDAKGDVDLAKRAYEDAKVNTRRTVDGQDVSFGDILKAQNDFEKVNKALEEKASERRNRQKTETESLTDSVRKLRGEVQSFQNVNSTAFKIRFEKEELERVRRDLEQIIDLRRELGTSLSGSLPTTAGGARTEREQLERVKNLRDDVLNIYKEIQSADDKIIVARLTATATVVDAQTRADTAYLTGLRARRDAEQQLTSEIAVELRKRTDLVADETRNQREIEAKAFLDFQANETAKSQKLLQTVAEIRLLNGEDFPDNPIITAGKAIAASAKPEQAPVLGRLDKANLLLESILKAISGSGFDKTLTYTTGEAAAAAAPSKRAAEVLNNVLRNTTRDAELTKAANAVAARYNFDPQQLFVLLKATLYRESSGRKGLVSEEGAEGYFQQLPDTQRKLGVRDPNNFEQAAEGAARYLVRGFGGGGALKGGIPEAFATYFAGEGGGNRGKKTKKYIRDQVYVFNEAMKALDQSSPVNAAPTPFVPKFPNVTSTRGAYKFPLPVDVPTTAAPPPPDDTLRNDTTITKSSFAAFGNIAIESLSQKSVDALKAYDQQLKEHNELTDAERIGIERVNLLTAVNITQKDELATSQARLNELVSDDPLRKEEALNDAQIARNRIYGDAIRNLIQINDELEKYRTRDTKFLAGLKAVRDEQRGRTLTGLSSDIEGLKEEFGRGGRDAKLERLKTEREYYQTLVNVGKTEAEIIQIRTLSAEPLFVEAIRRNAALTEQLNIERDILDAEGDIAAARVRIGDLTVFHAGRANATVLEHVAGMRGLTEIYSDFKTQSIDSVWSGIDSVFDRLTKKIPLVGSAISQLLSSLTKLLVNPLLMQILGVNPTGGGTAVPTGGGGSGIPTGQRGGGGDGGASLTGIIQNVLSGGSGGNQAAPVGVTTTGNGATPNVAPPPPISNADLASALVSAIGVQSADQRESPFPLPDPNNSTGGGRGGGVSGTVGGAGTSAASSLLAGGSFKDFGKSLGAMAPLLGLSLGSALGGQSIGGQILGGLGGLAGGLALGIGTGAIGASGGVIGGLVGALGGTLAATGILAAVAVPLLVGSWLLGRNKKRRQEETQRNAFLTDAKKQLNEILKRTNAGQMDSISALANAQAIRDNYMQQSQSLTDSKTRRHALQTVRELDVIIEQIKVAGRKSDFARAQDDAYVPTFDGGGMTRYVNSVASTSRNSYNDTMLARLNPETEAILTRRDVAALGGYPALNRAGVRGASIYSPSVVSQERAYSDRPSTGGGSGENKFQFVIVADQESADKIVSQSSGKATILKIKPLIASGQDDGFVDLVESKLAGEL